MDGGGKVVLDAGLIGFAGELLKRLAAPPRAEKILPPEDEMI